VGVLIATTIGLIFWVVATALGVKPFDAFLVTVGLTMLAATARIAMPFVRERLLP
jgi:hypothetical protein